VSLELPTENRVDQDGRHDANINNLVARYTRSGTKPVAGDSTMLFGDFTSIAEDIHALVDQIQDAEDRFMELPSSVRKAADHDWRTFHDMFGDEVARQVLVDAGLEVAGMKPTPPPQPSASEPAAPPANATEEPSAAPSASPGAPAPEGDA
jgi:hypothetical protein